MYHLIYASIWLISWLPLGVLYIFSDIAYPIVYYVIGYRRKVVRTNLTNSFPQKSKKERQQIERQFYRFFCDVFIETIAEMHMSKKEISRRFKYKNVDLITDLYAQGKSVLVMTAHYGNWEWASSLSLYLPEDKKLYGIFKRLNDKNFDRLMSELRMKFTGGVIETQDLFRTMLKFRKEGQLATFGMISDQTPPAKGIRHWLTFLNQDTHVFVGTEQMAKKFDYPVLYFESKRVKRGYYECEFFPIALNPKETKEFEISEKYMALLQNTIEADPSIWLWSHKRWKHKKEKYTAEKQ